MDEGMRLVHAVDHDCALEGRLCPHCSRPFVRGEAVFEDWAQTVAIHADCVVALALLYSLRDPTVAEIEANYDHRRETLLQELGDDLTDVP